MVSPSAKQNQMADNYKKNLTGQILVDAISEASKKAQEQKENYCIDTARKVMNVTIKKGDTAFNNCMSYLGNNFEQGINNAKATIDIATANTLVAKGADKLRAKSVNLQKKVYGMQ